MEETQSKKGRWKRPLQIVILVIAILICGVSIYNIVAITAEDQQSNASTEKMRTFVSARRRRRQQQQRHPRNKAPRQAHLTSPDN